MTSSTMQSAIDKKDQKRKFQDDPERDEPWPKRTETERPEPDQDPVTFLTLPSEVRLKILRKLLYSDEPLAMEAGRWAENRNCLGCHIRCHSGMPTDSQQATEKNFAFDVAILRTCRKLYAEGKEVLYGLNCFGMSIPDVGNWPPETGCDYWRCASFNGWEELPEAVATSVRKLHISLYAASSAWPYMVRANVGILVKALENIENLRELTIDVNLLHVNYPARRHWTADDLMPPFTLLRNLDRVTFKGAQPQHKDEIRAVMISKRPLVNLPRLYDDLTRFIHRMNGAADAVLYKALKSAERAVDGQNVALFMRSRELALERADIVYESRKKTALEGDQRNGAAEAGLLLDDSWQFSRYCDLEDDRRVGEDIFDL